MNLIIDEEFKSFIPPLTEDEKDKLTGSVVGLGVSSPLLVWKETGILIDGHNRYEICQKYNLNFTTKELSFDSREKVKRFMIITQLGRRNVSPEMASILRGKLHESLKMDQGTNNQHVQAKSEKCQSDTFQTTAQAVAKQTGVSAETVKREAQLVRALKKLGIPEADYVAGKAIDDSGKKRSRGSIIAEAFPPKVTSKKAKNPKATPEPVETESAPVEHDGYVRDTLVVEDEDDYVPTPKPPEIELEPWTITLIQLPKLTKPERQQLHDILETRWDCVARLSISRESHTDQPVI